MELKIKYCNINNIKLLFNISMFASKILSFWNPIEIY